MSPTFSSMQKPPFSHYTVQLLIKFELLINDPIIEASAGNICDAQRKVAGIDGRIKGSKAEAAVAAYGDSVIYPPKWNSARYRAVLAKENGQWKIRSLTMIEQLDE